MELNSLFASVTCHRGSTSVPARGTILNMRRLWHQHGDFLYFSEERKKQNHFLWERLQEYRLSNELRCRSYWDLNRIHLCFVKFYCTWPSPWNSSPVGKHRVMPFSTMPSRYRLSNCPKPMYTIMSLPALNVSACPRASQFNSVNEILMNVLGFTRFRTVVADLFQALQWL